MYSGARIITPGRPSATAVSYTHLDVYKRQVFYNPAVYEVADIIQTYVYRLGMGQMDFSLSTALGLFNSVVAFVLIVSANAISRKLLGRSIW